MVELRKLKRRQLIYYLKAIDRQTDKLLGRLADITTEGIMLISETPIEIDKNYQLRLILPSDMAEARFIDFEAKSLWNKKDVNPDLHDTGFRFIRVSPEDVEIIDYLIFDYELPS